MPILRLFRGLVRTPALTIAATLCIAIGVAATTAVATLANAVLLRPVPFPDAERLFRIGTSRTNGDGGFTYARIPGPLRRALRLYFGAEDGLFSIAK